MLFSLCLVLTMKHVCYFRFSAVKFSDGAEMQFNFNQYSDKQDVLSAINATKFMGGRTKTSEALGMMVSFLKQPTFDPVLIS